MLCALVVMLAEPLREYLGQRGQLAHERAANAALQQHVDQLQAQQRLWQDPDYVRQQARQRLYFVMPGETPYVVVGGVATKRSGPPEPAEIGGSLPPGAANGTTWYARLWSSVQAAGAGTGAGAGAGTGTAPKG